MMLLALKYNYYQKYVPSKIVLEFYIVHATCTLQAVPFLVIVYYTLYAEIGHYLQRADMINDKCYYTLMTLGFTLCLIGKSV